MPHKNLEKPDEPKATLRQRAEQSLSAADAAPIDTRWPAEIQGIIHELHVHQIELELQNEELRQTQEALEASRARYFDLYDLAPVGYLTLNAQGMIQEANLTAATLLQIHKSALVGQALARFISREDQDRYYLCLRELARTEKPLACELRLRQPADTGAWVWLEALIADGEGGERVSRIVLSDISAHKAAEEQARSTLVAEQARLQAEEAFARMSRLQAVTATLAGTLSRESLVEVFGKQVLEAAGASTAVITQIDPRDEQLEIIGWAGGNSEEYMPVIPMNASAPEPRAIRTRAPIWLSSRIEAAAHFPGLDREMERHGVAAMICLPLVVGAHVLGTISFSYPTPTPFAPERQIFLSILAQQCAQSLERARLYAEVLAGQTRLQQISRRLLTAQEEERHHLAHELHDEMGQDLTGLRMGIELAMRRPTAEREQRLTEILRTIQDLIRRVRSLALDLRPAMLDDMGLLPALIWQIKRYRERAGLVVELHQQGLAVRMPAIVETVAYRVVQEALTNVTRHAEVDSADVHLLATPTALLIHVRDSGRGFDLDAALSGGRSVGLAGMQERVSLLGGTLTIETRPGQGTRITAELPLDTATR